MPLKKTLKFPDGFLWGTGTSAHQVEGGNFNDWSEWEKSELRIKNLELKNLNPEDFISGRACDHYNLYEKDFDIAKSLGHNAHRFSIEWSRIEPEEGKFNEKEIEHYRNVIKALRIRGIEPFVTLWHWPVPLWLRDKGGCESKKFVNCFDRYTEKIVSSLKNDVKFWITLNEPEIFSGNSYLKGIWPPQKKNIFSYVRVIKNLIKAHKSSYKIIKKIDPNSRIGVAKNNIYFEAYKDRITNLVLKKFIDWWWNFYFLNQIKDEQDFIGLNHYFHSRINYGFNNNENKKISDMSWELYPEAIYYVLKDLKKYNKPIYITENGLADALDENRKWFIQESLKNIHKAIQEGVDVRGYLYWSLLDNFEWAHGYDPKFGLYSVDRKTFERKARPSAEVYADICKNNRILID